MFRKSITIVGLIVLFAAWCGAGEAAEKALDSNALFTKLTTLEGKWETAEVEVDDKKEKKYHVFEVSAAGTVVMETMFPGTDHEMINMYHVDGDDLMLTHYCAGGNQPRMKLDRETSGMNNLHFEYLDGTNLDPAVDAHIHRGQLQFLDEGDLKSTWISHKDGKEVMTMSWVLAKTN